MYAILFPTKKISLILILFLLISCSHKETKEKNLSPEFWTKEKAGQHFNDRQDSTTWNLQMFDNDLQFASFETDLYLPFTNGIFPTPDYDRIGKGSFKGVGNFGFPGGKNLEKKIQDKTILYNSFFAGASDVTKPFVGEKKDGVFFQIIVLTNLVDTLNYTHLSSEVVSRNHPDYMGQGYYKTQNNKIDYVAFRTANQNAYAIINMRLFDLSLGKTILIAPQKNKSLRSMQIKSPELSSDEIDAYTDSLLSKKEVIKFFTYHGNI